MEDKLIVVIIQTSGLKLADIENRSRSSLEGFQQLLEVVVVNLHCGLRDNNSRSGILRRGRPKNHALDRFRLFWCTIPVQNLPRFTDMHGFLIEPGGRINASSFEAAGAKGSIRTHA